MKGVNHFANIKTENAAELAAKSCRISIAHLNSTFRYLYFSLLFFTAVHKNSVQKKTIQFNASRYFTTRIKAITTQQHNRSRRKEIKKTSLWQKSEAVDDISEEARGMR